jgi:hypothetical protein
LLVEGPQKKKQDDDADDGKRQNLVDGLCIVPIFSIVGTFVVGQLVHSARWICCGVCDERPCHYWMLGGKSKTKWKEDAIAGIQER